MLYMTVELDAQVENNPLTQSADPETLPEREEGLKRSQGQQDEDDGMECRDVSRHDAIDDGAHERGIAQIERAGHQGHADQHAQLPPIGSREAEQA